MTTVAYTAIDRLRDVLRDLGEPTRMDRGDSFRTRGRCHDGDAPDTVSVRRVDGKVDIHCHKCDGDDQYLAAIGWTAADLYDEPREHRREQPAAPRKPRPRPVPQQGTKRPAQERPKEVARYPYCDEVGTLLYEVVRMEPGFNDKPKSFKQVPASGKTGPGAMDGVRLVPYRLPDVIRAAQAGEILAVVEGEKDVETLAAMGAVATTMPGGAGMGWRDDYTQHFKGAAEVIVIADRDATGREHAEKVADSLERHGFAYRVLESDRAKDITDHFAAGGTLDDLVPVTAPDAVEEPEVEHDQAPNLRTEKEREEYDRTPQIVFRRASSFNLKKTEWLWDTTKPDAIPHTEGRIPKAMLSVAAGLPGTGKSQFAIYVAAKITRGTLPGCLHGQPKNVIYAATEDDWERTIAPRLVAAGADMNRIFCVAVRTVESGNIKLNVAVHHRLLGRFAQDNDVALVVFDPLLSHVGGDLNANAETEVRAALEPLVKTAAEAGLTVLGLSHFNKGSSTDPMERLMGSRGFSALLRALIVFSRDKDAEEEGPARFVLSQAKSNLGRTDIPSYSYSLTNTVVQLEDGDETHVPRFVLGPESGTSVEKQLEQVGQSSADVEIGKDCVKWLRSFLMNAGGEADLESIKKAYKALDFSQPAVYRARKALGVTGETVGPAGQQMTVWRLPS